jgi:hypothetical protein
MFEKEALIVKWYSFDEENSASTPLNLLLFERRLLPRFFQAAAVSADPLGLLHDPQTTQVIELWYQDHLCGVETFIHGFNPLERIP